MTYKIELEVGSPNQLRDHIRRAAGHCKPGGSVRHTLEDMITQIEAQLKPAVVELIEFGSVVRARYTNQEQGSKPRLWQITPSQGKHYWEADNGDVEVWSRLTDVEVLRVGVGTDSESDEWKRLDAANADSDAYSDGVLQGRRVACIQAKLSLQRQLLGAITAERKDALEKAIKAVEDLIP